MDLGELVGGAVDTISGIVDGVTVDISYFRVSGQGYDPVTGEVTANEEQIDIQNCLSGKLTDEDTSGADDKTLRSILIPGDRILFDAEPDDYVVIQSTRWNVLKTHKGTGNALVKLLLQAA